MSMTADTFLLSLPEGWEEVDLDGEAIAERLRQTVDDELGSSPEFRRALLYLKRVVELAKQNGVVYAAGFETEVPPEAEDGEDAQPYPISGMCWLATRRAEDLSVPTIPFEALRQVVGEEPTDGRRRLDEPTIHELAAGPVIRELSVQTISSKKPAYEFDMVEARYHSLIGAGEGMATLSLSTPNVELAEELLGLFDAIAATLEFTTA